MTTRTICTADLHSHSGYSGGVGRIDLRRVLTAAADKGIDVFGCGDVLHPAWRADLRSSLRRRADGVWELPGYSTGMILQTEVVFTFPHPSGGRKSFHQVILFPDFATVEAAAGLLEGYKVKNTIGRPFIPCVSVEELRGGHPRTGSSGRVRGLSLLSAY